MKPVLDRSLFREAAIDSGALAPLSSIVHRIAEPGEYRGSVYRGAAKVGSFSVSVCDCPESSTGGDELPRQATVDLAALDSRTDLGTGDCPVSFSLRTGGYLVLVSTGSGGYALELFRRERKREPVPVFDSWKLGDGDLFTATIIRPGTYGVRNILGKERSVLTVEYPEPGMLATRPQPVLVECRGDAPDRAELTVLPGQTLMFRCAQEFRITVELERADDRPRPPRAPVAAPVATVRKGKKAGRRIRFFG